MASHHPSRMRQNLPFRHAVGILGLLLAILLVVQPAIAEPAQPGNGTLVITVLDAVTSTALAGAKVYPDGKFAGTTLADGTFVFRNQDKALRSVRVTADGYRENTTMAGGTGTTALMVRLSPSPVKKLLGTGSPEATLDIVFVASNTAYNCNTRSKVPAPRYAGHEDAFVSDVRRLCEENLFDVARFTRSPSKVPGDYRQRISVWYYWDEARYADAFDTCAGTLPAGFWDDAPFTDVAVILYPEYFGRYKGDSCEPKGCSNGAGPGLQTWFKVPADAGMLFLHESGHAIFGLMDTYCGNTYLAENPPFPNIWASGPGCRSDTAGNGLDASLCRPLTNDSPAVPPACGKGFYRYDPAPDLMGSTAAGARFGDASALRIRYMLDRFRGGG